MANIIRFKRSAVADKVPLVGDLVLGELAINTNDGRLFTLKDDGVVQVIELASRQTWRGRKSIPATTDTITVDFSAIHDFGDTNYTIAYNIVNPTLGPRSIYASMVTDKQSDQFTITLSGQTDNANYVVEWTVIDDDGDHTLIS